MKLAFVTGANKGIGLAIVEKLARALGPTGEWDVYLTARSEELGKKSCEALQKAGLNVKFHQLDITDMDSRKRFLQFVRANYPDGISIAVNNAGIAYNSHSANKLELQYILILPVPLISPWNFFRTWPKMRGKMFLILDAVCRVVQVSSGVSHMTLKRLSNDLYSKFTSKMDLDELRSCVADFVKHAEAGDHEKFGWPSWGYGVSKLALSKASYILGEMIKNDPRHIVMNACCPGYVNTDMTRHKGTRTVEEGADTPFYLATLPLGVTQPINEFVSDRKILPWSKDATVSW
ncbi:Carbonyl reductase [Paragonimus heterotremus]|uniref:Carbonyl reductase n=1 Tax=Paragonimus heterotremus TaxID=100268 RepID=A0A8J4SIT3_9TREM|nr:Carbonyl reductase [Paragonimus heterotremus]